MSGIKDVAALAKVSVPTVYKVFSNTYYTSPEIRKRVFDAAKELNYIPKSMKNPNKEKEAKTIAVFFDELVNPFYNRMIEEMRKQLEVKGYHLIVMLGDGKSETEKQNFELALSHKCDGIVFVPEPSENDETIQRLLEKDFPVLHVES